MRFNRHIERLINEISMISMRVLAVPPWRGEHKQLVTYALERNDRFESDAVFS